MVFFYRSPDCVPADFNLLDSLDFTPAFPGGPPRPFLCELQIEGRALWHSPTIQRRRCSFFRTRSGPYLDRRVARA